MSNNPKCWNYCRALVFLKDSISFGKEVIGKMCDFEGLNSQAHAEMTLKVCPFFRRGSAPPEPQSHENNVFTS